MAIDVFARHRYVLRFLGIVLPGEVPNRFLRALFHVWFRYLSICLPVLTLCFFFGVIHLHKDYSVTACMYSIAGVISSASASFKLYLLYSHRYDIKELVDFLNGFKADTTVGKITYLLTYFYEALALSFRVIALVEIFMKARMKLLMPFWTPFPRDNIVVALSTYFFFQGSAIIKTICNFFVDALLLLISNQACHRMFILRNTFKIIGLPEKEKIERLKEKHILKLPPGKKPTDENVLRMCVEEHILLLKVIDKFAAMVNRVFLPQSFNAFSSICVVLFLISQADDMVAETVKVIPWTTVIFLQLFVSCFAGELIRIRVYGSKLGSGRTPAQFLLLQCFDFFDSSYGNEWYNCDPRIKSSILVIQTYTSRPKIIKGAYVFELSLHTFEKAMREVFSTFTVLYQLFNTK